MQLPHLQLGRRSDDELADLARRRASDPAGRLALDMLVERYCRQRYSLARRFGGPGGADDLAQEAALALVRAVDTHRPARGPVGPWIWMWMWGSTLRAARREWSRWRTEPLEEAGDDALLVVGGALPTPAELVAEADSRRRESAAVGVALEHLPVETRYALVHRSQSAPSGRRKAEAMIRHPSVRPVTRAATVAERDGPAPSQRASSAGCSEGARRTPDPRGTWILVAACRGMAPETFFGRDGRDRADALRACARCPVRQECLLDALALPEGGGLRAGMGEKERRALRASHAEGRSI